MEKCINFRRLEDDQVQCRTCSHFCTISPGQVGICGVRKNKNGQLYLITYGKAASVQIDPIEKKPLYHFLPGSKALSFGTYGCNFRCGNCQNFSLSQIQGVKGNVEEYQAINWGDNWPPNELVEKALQANCRSIAYTYNEPTVFLEYALATMKLARQKGLKNVWVSNGFMSKKTLETIAPYLDAVNVDIKSFNDDFYRQTCGARVQPVLENCKRIIDAGIWLEVTTLIIPTLSDSIEMLRDLAKFIYHHLGPDVPWHISAFSASISWKMKNLPNTPPALISQVYQMAKDVGLNYVYAGKIGGGEMDYTYCPECGELVIKRTGYHLEMTKKSGLCPSCSHPLPGVFSD